MGARWEVALPLTMVSATRWENWVRAATRADASVGEESETLTRMLPPRSKSSQCFIASAMPSPQQGRRAPMPQVHG